MNGFDDNRQIYLYSHSPEAEKILESGEAAISAGGIRRPDGTMMDMAKPLSFTLDELKEMFCGDKQVIETEDKIKRLEAEMSISHEGIQELLKIGWLNNEALNQLYSLTYAGFRQTLSGIKAISSNVDNLKRYIELRDFNDIKEKTEKYVAFLGTDMQKLRLPNCQILNSPIDEHINEIGTFIKRMYDGLMNGTEDGLISCIIIKALIGPFSDVLKKYAVLFLYENGVAADWCSDWAKLIYEISTDERFREKVGYYIQLEMDLPYRDKVILERDYIRKIESVYDALMFDVDYALYHNKEEYLSMEKTIQKLVSSLEGISEDGNIYM